MRKIVLYFALAVMIGTWTGCFFEDPGTTETTTVSETISESASDTETTVGDEATSSAGYQQISQEEAKELMQNSTDYLILDVRRQDEYDLGHIPGAILVPNESITDTPPAELPDKNQMILIYCRSGNRSKQAAEKLVQMGYTNLYEFGGINTWDGMIVTSGEVDHLQPDPESDGEWKKAYRTIVTNYQNSNEDTGDELSEIRWDLQDLDSDGTPELLISDGLFHVAGVQFYYFEDGNAQLLLDDSGEPLRYGVYGEVLICPAEHLLGVGNMHMGYNYTGMHRYEDHQLTQVLTFMEDSGAVGEEKVTYTVNDVTVDKSAYDAALAEFNSREWTACGRQFALDDLSVLE